MCLNHSLAEIHGNKSADSSYAHGIREQLRKIKSTEYSGYDEVSAVFLCKIIEFTKDYDIIEKIQKSGSYFSSLSYK